MIEVINIKHFRGKDDQYVYIGRGKGGLVPESGYGMFGNPVAIGRVCPVCGETHRDGGSTLPCYRVYLWARLQEKGDLYWRMVRMAQQHNLNEAVVRLGCFCHPKPCHGEVLKRAIEWLAEQLRV